MQMEYVHGRTYYINFPSIVGVYVFKDESCLLIDSGPSAGFAKRVLKILEQENINVRAIINTHAHADHSGGNQYIQEMTGCDIYASLWESCFIQNELLGPYCLYSASPINALRNKFLMPSPSRVTEFVKPGELEVNGEKFVLVDLAGHSLGHLGIKSPDGVFFTGDSIIAKENTEKFPFLYTADLVKHFASLERIKGIAHTHMVISHGGLVFDEAVSDYIDYNEKLIEYILNLIRRTIKMPQSREEIVRTVIKEMDLPDNRNQYFLISGSVSAYLSYLCNTKQACVYTEDGVLKFLLKK